MKRLLNFSIVAMVAMLTLGSCADTAPESQNAQTYSFETYDPAVPVYFADLSASSEASVYLVQDSEPGTDPAPIGIMAWVGIIAGFLYLQLGAIQFLLRRIPTPRSVKIQGIIGKLLDLLVFWQPDNSERKG